MRLLRSLLSFGIVAVSMRLVEPRALAQEKGPGDPPRSGGTGASRPKAGTPPAAAPKPSSDGALALTPEAAAARGMAFYDAGQYDQCADQLGALLADSVQAADLTPRSREQAYVYRAACLIAQGKLKEADDAFRTVIRENPQMSVPSTVVFPQAVIERFVIVRTTLFEEIRHAEEERVKREREAAAQTRKRAEAERARVAQLEKLAAEETVVAQNHRWLAYVPFGVGQFQNRAPVLGAVFLSSEIILVGTAVTSALIELHLNSQARGGSGFTDQGQIDQLNQNLRTANQVGLYATGGFVLVAAAGVLQANLAFVPEYPIGVRPRGAARRTRAGFLGNDILPTAAPTKGGAMLGAAWRF